MAELTRESAKKILANRIIITTPGKYQVVVTNNAQALAESGKVTKAVGQNGRMQVSILAVAAMTDYHFNQAKALLKEGDFTKATNQQLSTALLNTDADRFPRQYQTVEIEVGYFTNKEGIQALGIQSWNHLPVSTGTKVTAEMFDDEDDAEHAVEMEFTAAKTTAKVKEVVTAPFEA